MEKRFQVFVSSTYRDLREEREQVIQALLELDCIPSGMELFPASDDEKWALIQKVIDDCDYYIVVIGGRYGSTDEAGMSFTEREYDYAVGQGKPAMAFLPASPESIPAGKTEVSEAGRKALAAFIEKVSKKMCRPYKSPEDLGAVVSRSLVKLIKTHPAEGWVRGRYGAGPERLEQMEALRERIAELETALQDVSTKPPEGTEELLQGSDTLNLRYLYKDINYHDAQDHISLPINFLFGILAPLMMDECEEPKLEEQVSNVLLSSISAKQRALLYKGFSHELRVHSDDFQGIKIQLVALGLIRKSEKKRGIRDTSTYWTLTPYGYHQLLQLRALRRKQSASKT